MADWRSTIIASDTPKKQGSWRDTIIASQPAPAEDKTSAGGAALQGFGEGGTLGYLPEAQAALAKAGEVILPQSMGGAPIGQSEDFSKLKDYFKNKEATMKEEHPVASVAGNVAGSLMTLPIAEVGLAKAGLSMAPAASTLAKFGRAAAVNGGLGALQNTEGEGLDAGERAKNAAIGAGFGAGGEALAQGAQGVASGFNKLTGRATVKQIGANAGQIKKLMQKDEIPMIGEFLENEGLMGPGKSVDDVAAHTKEILQTDGPKIGQLYRDAQAAAGESVAPISGPDLADQISDNVTSRFKNHTDRDLVKKTISEAVGPLKDMGEDASLTDLHEFRKSLDENINWGKSSGEKDAVQKAYLEARNTVNDAIKSKLKTLDEATGGTHLDDLKALNDRFSTASTINTLATQGSARDAAKAFLGQGIIGGGAGGLAGYETYKKTGDPLKAAAVGVGTGLAVGAARKYGSPVGYYGGKMGEAAADALSQQGPQIGRALSSPWLNMSNKQKKDLGL